MLLEFRVANYRSILTEQALSMEVGRVGDPGDPRPRTIAGHATPLLCCTALYGSNASGKTNFLSALAFMRNAVADSHRAWPPEGGVPREPFGWGPGGSTPSVFEATFVLGETRYQYGFSADDQQFTEEWLYSWPSGRKRLWFKREGTTFKFGESLGGENRIVEKFTRDNALFLSAAAQNGHAQLTPLYQWFARLRTVNLPGRSDLSIFFLRHVATAGSVQLSLFENGGIGSDFEEKLLDLLKSADLGIVDFKVAENDEPDSHSRRMPRFLFQHKASSGEAWLPLEAESRGTATLFRVGPTLIQALKFGGLVIFDELEASLHPLLAKKIVEQFDDPALNPHNAQLIFTTHDTNLLGSGSGAGQPLRRDQVWLTEKDNEGGTHLYPLTDYKPRLSENLERGYLQGRYGAIPLLGKLIPPDDPDAK
jgi:hypothetical protein